MLRFRLMSAFCIISAALTFVALDAFGDSFDCRGFWIVPFGFFLIFGSAFECVGMLKKGPIGDVKLPALLGCAGVMLAACVPVYWPLSGEAYPADCMLGALGWPFSAGLIAIVACIAWYMPSYVPGSNFLPRAIMAGWVSVYFGGCFAFAIAIRLTGEPEWGLFLLVGVIMVTKVADAGAYFSGRALGRTKLCPAVSPGKTIEGLIGGMVSATLAGWVYFNFGTKQFFEPEAVSAPLLGVFVLGVLLTIAGVIGDLVESIFKRESGCKDSGSLMPGLGGLWDVTDSLLPAMVVGYLVVVAELIKGPGQ